MPPTPTCRGTLSNFLAADDIVAFSPLSDDDWNEVRADATRILLRQFCTLRNLWVHRGTYILDILGNAWAGIYRSLLVGSIVTTSYRNEGHIRAGDRNRNCCKLHSLGFRVEQSPVRYSLTDIRVASARENHNDGHGISLFEMRYGAAEWRTVLRCMR